MSRKTSLGLVCAFLAAGASAHAQNQIKSRVMVLLDTSGSMGFHFKDPAQFGNPPNGDYPGGDGSSSYSDLNLTNAFMFPGRKVNNNATCTQQNMSGCDGINSRLFAAKEALSNGVNGFGGDV